MWEEFRHCDIQLTISKVSIFVNIRLKTLNFVILCFLQIYFLLLLIVGVSIYIQLKTVITEILESNESTVYL